MEGLDPATLGELESALAGIDFNDDKTLWYTFEALHDLCHTLGDLHIDQVHGFMQRFVAVPDNEPGNLREMVAEFNGALRVDFVKWMREHEVPHLKWWVHHSTGQWLLWEIHHG